MRLNIARRFFVIGGSGSTEHGARGAVVDNIANDRTEQRSVGP
jgi:hypothetical protein